MPRKIIMTDSDEESTGELLCSDEECGEPECEAKRRVNRQSRLPVPSDSIYDFKPRN